jgi:hypothetical protein
VVENRQQWDTTAQRAQQQSDQHLSSEYTTGYRGAQEDQQVQAQSPESAERHVQGSTSGSSAMPLYYDQCGRPYICENGRRVYVHLQQEQSHSVGYRGTSGQPHAAYDAQQDPRLADRQQSESLDQQRMRQQDQYRSAQRQAPPVMEDRGARDQSSGTDRSDEPDSASNLEDDDQSSSAEPDSDSEAATEDDENRDDDSDNADTQSEQI